MAFWILDAIEKQYQAVRNLYENTDLFTNPKYASALNSETGEVDYNSDAFKQMFADHLKELAASAVRPVVLLENILHKVLKMLPPRLQTT